jgi:hypothetical protein
VRVEAENFGHEGEGKSYAVKDARQRSKFYRHTEPVRVTSDGGTRRRGGQHITLAPGEWTAYQVRSDAAQDYAVTLRLKPVSEPVELELVVGPQVKAIRSDSKDWSDLSAGVVSLAAGANSIKVRVKRGEVELDWFDVGSAQTQQSAQIKPATAAQ